MPTLPEVQSQITFLYYDDLAAAADFYSGIMGFDLVEDQGWAKIYRVAGNAFLGIVAGDRGSCRTREENAVLVTLVVDDVPGWYDYLQGRGVTLLSQVQHRADIQIDCFFLQDPGGYKLEIQRFLKPEVAEIFG